MNVPSVLEYVSPYSPFTSSTTEVTVEGERYNSDLNRTLTNLRDCTLDLLTRTDLATTPTPTSNHVASKRSTQECDPRTHKEFRAQAAEINKLHERCKWLESTVKSKDKEMEELRRDRDRLLEEKRAHVAATRAQQRNEESQARRSEESNTSSSSSGSKSSAQSRMSVVSTTSAPPPTFQEEYIAHLQSFDVFMTKSDNWSGAQVIQAVRDLNSEIIQFAASATELCTFDKESTTSITQATQNTSSRLGSNLANLLATRDHSQDPILIQFALQAALCGCIHRSLNSFCVGFPAKYDALLGQLYLRMCSKESQPISSRWRSLTHRYIHELFPSLESQAMDEIVDLGFRWSADILALSGSPSPHISIEALRSRFTVQLRRVAQGACRLARITREQIISTNFEVLHTEHGTVYDGRNMVNVFEQYGANKGRVLCTSEIGLRCFRTGDEDRGNSRILLLPKVVLESVIQVL